MPPPLAGRRVQVAGSVDAATAATLAHFGHEVVRRVVAGIIEQGGGLVIGAGKEPRLASGEGQVFDWTVLDAVAQAVQDARFAESEYSNQPVVVVLSEKGESEIPDVRRPLWDTLLRSGKVEVRRIMAGARSGAMIRHEQASHGDILLILGGGTGVEHLAEMYRRSLKPVIPLDVPLGASRADGTGGAERLARESRRDPQAFIRFGGGDAGGEGAALSTIATNAGTGDADRIAAAVQAVLLKLIRPTAFYVRLLNREHPRFGDVERFFRGVVDPVVDERGLTRIDLGVDPVESGFLNVEVFRRLHYAATAIVDVTGERPNCFIELGYALGREMRVICTAAEGTALPFDQVAIPCHFWSPTRSDADRRKELQMFWSHNAKRSPLVS